MTESHQVFNSCSHKDEKRKSRLLEQLKAWSCRAG